MHKAKEDLISKSKAIALRTWKCNKSIVIHNCTFIIHKNTSITCYFCSLYTANYRQLVVCRSEKRFLWISKWFCNRNGVCGRRFGTMHKFHFANLKNPMLRSFAGQIWTKSFPSVTKSVRQGVLNKMNLPRNLLKDNFVFFYSPLQFKNEFNDPMIKTN